jgi:DNA-binding NarL/FixJ family response regulator
LVRVRILVVDDHKVVRTSYASHLLEGEKGWEVCGEAADGDEAVEVPNVAPDVVVMDAVMPRRNGFDATREIVRNSPEIPVVITTLYEYPEILRQAQISGALGCVGKS